MSLVVIATVAAVWIFFALMLAVCARDLDGSRRSRSAPARVATAWIGEEHAPVIRRRDEAPIPPGHPLARIALRAPGAAGRPSV